MHYRLKINALFRPNKRYCAKMAKKAKKRKSADHTKSGTMSASLTLPVPPTPSPKPLQPRNSAMSPPGPQIDSPPLPSFNFTLTNGSQVSNNPFQATPPGLRIRGPFTAANASHGMSCFLLVIFNPNYIL